MIIIGFLMFFFFLGVFLPLASQQKGVQRSIISIFFGFLNQVKTYIYLQAPPCTGGYFWGFKNKHATRKKKQFN